LEPDRKGGAKQISKEYITSSANLIQDDPLIAKQTEDMLYQQQKKEKKKSKRKEYIKKKKAK